MAVALGARVKPTKGFLLQLKKRVNFIEEGYKLLELKRDELANELRRSLGELATKKRKFEEKIEEALDKLGKAYASLGSDEMTSQTWTIKEKLEIDILPKSVMGILVPYVKILNKPTVTNKFSFIARSVAEEFYNLVDELIEITELESRIERIADDLEKTNRKVNALEKIVIPEYKRIVKQIEDRLDEDMLEELIRTKFVRTLISERRG